MVRVVDFVRIVVRLSLTVMAGAGPHPRLLRCRRPKIVDGAPAPAMTVRDRQSNPCILNDATHKLSCRRRTASPRLCLAATAEGVDSGPAGRRGGTIQREARVESTTRGFTVSGSRSSIPTPATRAGGAPRPPGRRRMRARTADSPAPHAGSNRKACRPPVNVRPPCPPARPRAECRVGSIRMRGGGCGRGLAQRKVHFASKAACSSASVMTPLRGRLSVRDRIQRR